MVRKDAGPRGLKIRSESSILAEIRFFAETTEAIRAKGSHLPKREEARKKRLMNALLENCRYLAQK